MERLRILVADDEPAIAKSTAILLKDLGHEPIIESDPEKIAATLASSGAQVLLQDIHMPGLDVTHHIAALRADPRFTSVRIYLFSASLEVAGVALRLPVDGHIEKPFTREGLLAMVNAPSAPTTT